MNGQRLPIHARAVGHGRVGHRRVGRGRVGRGRVGHGLVALGLAALVVGGVSACGGDDDPGNGPTQASTAGATDGPSPSTPAPVQPRPDFVITAVQVSPGGPLVPPGEVTIRATVRNVGSAAYPQTIVVQAPGNHSGAIIGGLAVGQSADAVIKFPVVSSAATYRLTLTIDPDNVTVEEDESNNDSQEITITTSG